jgi:dTDP-4-dehydrorhamnose reductase
MRVLILGGSGMLGHALWQDFSDRFDAYVTLRRTADSYPGLFDPGRTVENVSADDVDSVARAMTAVRPDVVVNAIGIVKQAAAASDPVPSLTVNALFPHRLAALCEASGARLIHMSTDCVFSGRKGGYRESDVPDAEDLYGRSKLLGEVDSGDCLTLRTSIIGRELGSSHGLLEWFLSRDGGTVSGYRRAIFSGFTTQALADMIAWLLADQRDLRGIWHVASEPISKYDLLCLLKEHYRLDIEIEPDDAFACDRSLDGREFRRATGFTPKPWPEMIAGLPRRRALQGVTG